MGDDAHGGRSQGERRLRADPPGYAPASSGRQPPSAIGALAAPTTPSAAPIGPAVEPIDVRPGDLAAGVPSVPAPAPIPRSGSPAGRGLARRLLAGLSGLVAAVVYLTAGLPILLLLALYPLPGSDVALTLLKASGMAGWVAIGAWLIVDWWRLRYRVLLAPFAAWVLAWAVVVTGSHLGVLAIGP